MLSANRCKRRFVTAIPCTIISVVQDVYTTSIKICITELVMLDSIMISHGCCMMCLLRSVSLCCLNKL